MKQLSACECMITKDKMTDPRQWCFERLPFFLFILLKLLHGKHER